MMQTLPYWRLSFFYAAYFAVLGGLLPFLPLYFEQLGFEPIQIGQLMAVLMATKIVAPNIWGWLADHTGKQVIWVRLGAWLSALCFVGMFWGHSYAWLMGMMITYSFFWNAILPSLEVITLTYLGENAARYTQIRLWGSVGFILCAIGLGIFFEYFPVSGLLWIVLAIFIVLALVSLTIPDATRPVSPAAMPLLQILRQPSVIALLLLCLLIQASFSVYYTFYSLYLESYGYSRPFIGWLWALGVIAEVVIFIFMHHLVYHYSLKNLLLFTAVVTGLRWLLIAYGVQNIIILLGAQVLHAVSFGLYHGAAIQFIRHYFPGHLQARGQALYSSLSFGIGGALGSVLFGYTWEYYGAQWSFLVAMMLCFIALGVGGVWIKDIKSV